jgi:hypothetical protein
MTKKSKKRENERERERERRGEGERGEPNTLGGQQLVTRDMAQLSQLSHPLSS